jgi:hypothetical protein
VRRRDQPEPALLDLKTVNIIQDMIFNAWAGDESPHNAIGELHVDFDFLAERAYQTGAPISLKTAA